MSFSKKASVAQSVEQLTLNQLVDGSNPPGGTKIAFHTLNHPLIRSFFVPRKNGNTNPVGSNTMMIRQNLHIHSSHSCDSACATIKDIQREMLDYGMTEFGLSDHVHSAFNLCDIASSRNDFDVYATSPCFHFGIEATCMAKWECDAIAAGNYKRQGDDPVYGLRYAELPMETPELTLGITGAEIQ